MAGGHGVDHPPPSSAEVKERIQLYLNPPLPLWAYEASSRVNFTFTFIIIIIIIIIIIMFIDCEWVDTQWQWSFNMLHMHGLWRLII